MPAKEKQVKNTVVYLLPIITNNVFPFITIPVFTRILTKNDYGVLALTLVYAVFVTGLANFGMTAAYDRNYFQHRADPLHTAQLLYSILLFVLANFVLFACLTYFFRESLSRLIIGCSDHGDILFFAFCAQFFSSINFYYLTYFRNSEIAKDFATYTIAAALINFVISLVLVAYIRIGVIGIIYAQLCSGVVIFGILSCKFLAAFPLSLSKERFVESLKIAYPLTPRVFLGVIGTQFDKYMIGLLASVGATGIYSIGQRVSYVVFTYMTAIENVFSPQVYRRMFELKEKGGEAIGRYLTPFAYVCVFLALLIALFSEEVISILTPMSFHGAIEIVAVLSMYYGFLFFGKLTGNQLIFMKKTHITSILTALAIGLNVALNIPFILKWGALGAAWATLLAGLISGAISFCVAQHYYEVKWEYRRIAAIFLILFASVVLIVLLRATGLGYPIRLALKGVFTLSYLYLGIRIKVITHENYDVVKRLFFSRDLLQHN